MRSIALAASTLLFAWPAQSEPAATPAPAQAAPVVQKDYQNEVICHKEEVTGSRLATRRKCQTRAEWEREQMDDKAWLDRVQRRGDASSQ